VDSFLFYVMPFVEGESLRDRLDREHLLPVDDAVRIAEKVAEGLDYAPARASSTET
jgi:serine/threonine protein kinase